VDAKSERIEHALRAVLPAGTAVVAEPASADLVHVEIGAPSVGADGAWIGDGWLSDVRRVLTRWPDGLDFVTARRLSPDARAAASEAGLGWIDESGAAELSLPGVTVSRSGQPEPKRDPVMRWTRSVVGTAEALLLGARPTVADVGQATGLSAGAATRALSTLTALGLLQAAATRGRNSARQIVDRNRLLREYATAATALPAGPTVRVGVVGDLVSELAYLGRRWDADGIVWAATGAAAASVMAPYLSQVTTVEVFVDVSTPASLDALAERSGLRPTDAGRLLLRPFPTSATQRLGSKAGDIRVAPWPRVYADLRISGVRGEEAAEHLREVIDRG
jgi:hypothetical protein